ncbi:MAG TPA: hypothetical protein VIU13_04715 [Chryseolinea sp.]
MTGPQPSIYPFGIRIDEPIATVTDVLVSAVCFYAFYKLTQKKLPGRSQWYFRYYFFLIGIATFLGGVIGHGFLYALSFPWKLPGWTISMVSVAMIERSAISHARRLIKPAVARVFLIVNIIELVIVMTVTMVTLDFFWVQFHSAYGLLIVVFSFHAFTYYRTKDMGSATIMWAVGITAIASLVFMNEFSLHVWFNYLDLSHILLAIASYVFYRGALELGRREGKQSE